MALYIALTIATIIVAGVFIHRDAYERGREHGRSEERARLRHPAGRIRSNVVVRR